MKFNIEIQLKPIQFFKLVSDTLYNEGTGLFKVCVQTKRY